MRLNYILVDYENVQPKDFGLLAHECFRVLVFVGASQKGVCADTAMTLQALGDRAAYVRTSACGKNALDSHLHFYLGRLVTTDPDGFFHVISKDTGFDPLLAHLRENGVSTARRSSLEEIPSIRAHVSRISTERAGIILERLKNPKATLPGTVAKLSNLVASHFGKALPDAEVAAIVSALAATGFLHIAKQRVVYGDANVVPFVPVAARAG